MESMEQQKESQKFSDLGEKERERYNQGFDRVAYGNFFDHCRYFYIRRRQQLITENMEYAQGKKVLEIGSTAWKGWLEPQSIIPSSLTCINISEAELERGINSAIDKKVSPEFLLMDAHNLQFEDETFDMVYGDAILHHLNLTSALDEIYRVLKPNGKICFVEPLDMNPVGKIVRALTKGARTEDEQPLRLCDIAAIKKRFNTQFFYEEFLSVPCGVLSRMIFKNPDNSLMRFAFTADQFLDRNFALLRNWFRHALISGTRD